MYTRNNGITMQKCVLFYCSSSLHELQILYDAPVKHAMLVIIMCEVAQCKAVPVGAVCRVLDSHRDTKARPTAPFLGLYW